MPHIQPVQAAFGVLGQVDNKELILTMYFININELLLWIKC